MEDSRSGIPGKCLMLVSRKQGSKTSCFFLALIYHGSRDSWQEVSNANALALGIWLVVFMLTRTSENRLHCWWKSEELVLLSCLSVGSSLPTHPPPKTPCSCAGFLCSLSLPRAVRSKARTLSCSLSSQTSRQSSPCSPFLIALQHNGEQREGSPRAGEEQSFLNTFCCSLIPTAWSNAFPFVLAASLCVFEGYPLFLQAVARKCLLQKCGDCSHFHPAPLQLACSE